MDLSPTRTAFLFPGQGSQAVGMGQALAQAFPAAGAVFAEADQFLGFPLSRLAWEGPAAELDDTVNTQPALLVHSIAALTVFRELWLDFQPAYTAGHSMGEVSALVACGALPYPAALSLARRRGELMKEAGQLNPGGMAAILGLDIPGLEDLCARASQPGEVVQVANDNCPGQVVVSGASPALERLIELAKAAGARRALKLAVSIAAHSPLMAHAQAGFSQAVEAACINNPLLPLVGNVNARPLDSAVAIRVDLQAQLNSRVRWTESIQWMAEQGIDTYIEMGNGSVLCGLVKRIQPEAICLTLGTLEDFQKLGI